MDREELRVLGIMSGSSLDGVDLGLFFIDTTEMSHIRWEILNTQTFTYPDPLKTRLAQLENISASEYFAIENRYTDYLIEICDIFLTESGNCDLIGLHGHTFEHKPKTGYSIQMGSGGKLCEALQVPCVTDFRTQDISAGGQGAPMAPLVDHLLFPEYDSWINLGGIVNITTRDTAYDIGPFNQVSNYLALKENIPFDKDGNLGKKGKFIPEFQASLENFPFYKTPPPKSLDNLTLRQFFYPLIDLAEYRPTDMLHTFYHHIADKISTSLKSCSSCLLTGGGAHNKYFLEVLNSLNSDVQLFMPSTEIIDFKESLLIALAAQLRYYGHPNYIKGITAADSLVSAGALYIHSLDE